MDFQQYVYADSLRNIVVYPDSTDYDNLIIENFANQKMITAKLELYKKCAIAMLNIDTIFIDEHENMVIKYRAENGEIKKQRIEGKIFRELIHEKKI